MHTVITRSVLFLALIVATSLHAAETPITVQDLLGHDWPTGLVHRAVDFESAAFMPGQVALFEGASELPVQLAAVVTNANGTLKRADVWFLIGLASNQTRTLILRDRPATRTDPPAVALIAADPHAAPWHVLSNAFTSVRLPAGTWQAPADETPAVVQAALSKRLGLELKDGALPGPLQGVRLPSGRWTAVSRLGPARPVLYEPLPGLIQPETLKIPGAFEGYETEVLAAGPLFARARVTYRFAGGGRYVMEAELRAGEPMVRFDERYDGAGSIVFDLGRGFQPTGAVHVAMSSAPGGRSV